MENQEQATLRDVINYEPEQYLSDDEVKLIQDTFRGNKKLLGVLRKVLMPTVADPDLPIEEFGKDMFLVGREYSQIPASEMKQIVLAREEAVKFICGGLISLKQIASLPIESPLDKNLKAKKDSTK
jgi:hypothetical protein